MTKLKASANWLLALIAILLSTAFILRLVACPYGQTSSPTTVQNLLAREVPSTQPRPKQQKVGHGYYNPRLAKLINLTGLTYDYQGPIQSKWEPYVTCVLSDYGATRATTRFAADITITESVTQEPPHKPCIQFQFYNQGYELRRLHLTDLRNSRFKVILIRITEAVKLADEPPKKEPSDIKPLSLQ